MARATPPVNDEQIARVFRSLAEEHATQREPTERRTAWGLLEDRALAAASSRRGGVSAMRWLAPALAALVVLLLGAWLRQPSLDFHVSGAVVKDGEIRATTERGIVAFTDGSRVETSQGTALSVNIVGEHAALTRLTRGNLRVDVRHEDDTDWVFLAGPYEVKVVGTQFDLGWDPEASRVSIAMREGRVRVRGPGKLDRMLSKGETLEWPPAAPPRPARTEAVVAAQPQPMPSLTERSVTEKPPRVAKAAPNAATLGPRSPSAAVSDGWEELVSRGRFDAVVEAAERAGIDSVLSARGPVELRALAHAARYTGRTVLALRTWQTIRERFAKHSAAQHAAFFVGRIHDQLGRASEARRWLGIYLAEAPHGVYASEALGRQLLLVERGDGQTEAKRVARQYLERFPNGAYAKAARSIAQAP